MRIRSFFLAIALLSLLTVPSLTATPLDQEKSIERTLAERAYDSLRQLLGMAQKSASQPANDRPDCDPAEAAGCEPDVSADTGIGPHLLPGGEPETAEEP